MVDYVLPDEYPYKDVGEPGAEPLRSADYNPLLAAVADLGAAGGRVAALEGNPILNADAAGAAVGGVYALRQTADGFALSGAAPVYSVRTPTGDAAADTAHITALAQEAAAAGGGIVQFPGVRYPITAPLPILRGVRYRGVTPQTTPTYVTNGAWMPDGPVSLTGGTVIVGNGTFDAFAGNTTPLGSPGANPGTAQIDAAGVEQIGIENVRDGINIGATNLAGVMWGYFRDVFVTDATRWGVNLTNFMHCDIRNIRTFDCIGGQRYANDMPQLTIMTGNSQFGELFNVIPRGVPGFLARGIVFEAVQGAFNENVVERLQVNAMARTQLADTLTLTSGSSAISVPDASKYAAGLWLVPGATLGGFTSGTPYVVQSVNTGANTIVLGTASSSGTITPNASGTLAITSWGMPCLELIGRGTAAVMGSGFRHLDLEGDATVAVHAENISKCEFGILGHMANGNYTIVGRKVQFSVFSAMESALTDFDSNSTSSYWIGARTSGGLGRKLPGLHSGGVSLGGGAAGDMVPDLVLGLGGYIYPHAGIGKKIFTRDADWSANSAQSGLIVYTSPVNRTITLPTILDSDTPANRHLGLTFEIVNAGTATGHVVNTGGGQLFNKVAGLTSLSVAPGQVLKVTAVEDWQNVLWWYAERATLPTS